MPAPSGPVSAPSDMERAMFAFVDAYNGAYAEAARIQGLPVAHACVLSRLNTPRAMGELADELRCDASNVTQIVSRLEARSLAFRQADPTDRRSRRIVRTSDGDHVTTAFHDSFEFARQVAANLSSDEQEQFVALLTKATHGAAHEPE